MSFIRKRCDELQIELKPFFQKCKTISKNIMKVMTMLRVLYVIIMMTIFAKNLMVVVR